MRRDRRRSNGGGALDEDQGVGRAETVVRSEKKYERVLDEDQGVKKKEQE